MKPASRTPEGEPNRCAVCGKSITLEHSIPPGDAPCPNCGCLVWFDSTGVRVEVPHETIEQTKQKMQQLVREVAKLAHDDIEPRDFYWEFLTRVVRSLAAVGGAVWMLENRGWPIRFFSRQRLRPVCEMNVPDTLPATQRGYQQFLKMMCRLGSELLDREPASVAKG